MQHAITLNLDGLLHDRQVSLAELARRTGISTVNLSLIKNNHVKAIRFTTLTAICRALDCVPGDLIGIAPR
jgi:putative transcriptional regulator